MIKREIVYVRVLDIFALIGNDNREIYYVKHSGNFEKLMQEAVKRNIVTTSISKREYSVMENKFWLATDLENGLTPEDVLSPVYSGK